MIYSQRFEQFFPLLIEIEGGHTVDTGGDTWWGISRNAYPNETPWPPTFERVKDIYWADFYIQMRCDDIIEPHFAFQFFVAAVNVGVPRAKKLIWSALSMPLDGQIIGRLTLEKLNDFLKRDADKIYSKFLRELNKWYFHLAKTNPTVYGPNLEGWVNRMLIAIDI